MWDLWNQIYEEWNPRIIYSQKENKTWRGPKKILENWGNICKNQQTQKLSNTIYAKNPQLRKSRIWKTKLKKKDENSWSQEYWKENKIILNFS